MWELLKLSDVCTIINGGTPDSKKKIYWDGEIQWLTPKDMGKVKSRFISKTQRQITSQGLASSSAKLIPENSLILSCRAPIGYLVINKVPMAFNQGCKGLIPNNKITIKFLYYFLLLSKDLLNELGTGTTFREISSKKLANIPISVPPVAHQERIVVKLDTIFAEINKIVDLTKEKIIKENDVKLSILNSIFSNIESKKTVGEIATVIAGQSPESKYYNKDAKGIPFYQGKKEFGDYELKKPIFWTTRTTKEALKGDVLLSVRAPVGETNICNDKICIGRGLAAIRANNDISSEFVFYFLNSIKNQIVGNIGAVFNSINKKQIEDIIIPVPSINKQNEIISKINILLSHIKEINLYTKQKLDYLSALKSSILKQEIENKAV